MAYKDPDTALYHLKVAQSYLDDTNKTGAKNKEPNGRITNFEVESCRQKTLDHPNQLVVVRLGRW